MLTDRQIIQRLYDTGHFFSRQALAVTKVTAADLDKLVLAETVVVEAAASYQEFMQLDLQPLVYRFHHRALLIDGGIGPATREQLEMPRCACPDYHDPDHATGDGSWPMPCQMNGVLVHINKSNMPAALTARWDKIQADVFAIYADIGCRLSETLDKDRANITVWWTVLAGSTIGIAEFNSESCNDTVTLRLDPGYTQYMASLFAHELGHNCNLQHRGQGGIMHPSIQRDPVPFTWRNDPSFGDLVKLFGGKPLASPPVPVPVPPPTPTPGDPWYGSRMKLERPGLPDEEWIHVPKV